MDSVVSSSISLVMWLGMLGVMALLPLAAAIESGTFGAGELPSPEMK